MIYSTKTLAQEFENHLADKISTLCDLPTLHVIQIGEDFASSKYVSIKQAKCHKLGIPVIIQKFQDDTLPSEVEDYIRSIPHDHSGVILQLPVAPQYTYLVDKIDYRCDIDLLTTDSFLLTKTGTLSPTIGAIDLVLKSLLQDNTGTEFYELLGESVSLRGKIVAVIGQGKLVGTPLLSYLQKREATIISINKDTLDPQELTKMADVIISAAGVENLVNSSWVKSGAIVIDAATLESNGSQKGDVDKEKIGEDVILCPSPGGIGGLTVLYLLQNLIALNEYFTSNSV
jgi:methylenetetrahydrofolate dehydrogenase (NADP+) / methenyltetrahydrofolate cyclohydrolase